MEDKDNNLQAKLIKPKIFKLDKYFIPKVNFDEILVRVMYAGVCGTDIHSFLGENRFIKNYPIVLGHEFIGEIIKLGNKKSRFKIGDIVTSEPFYVCNKCEYCKRGDYNLCENLVFMEGAFSYYVIVKEQMTYKIPKNIDLPHAVFIEPLSVALHAMKISKIREGQSILIFGILYVICSFTIT